MRAFRLAHRPLDVPRPVAVAAQSDGRTSAPSPMLRPDASARLDIRRRAPISGAWSKLGDWPGGTAWVDLVAGVRALSSVEIVTEPVRGPQWHVSISVSGPMGPVVAPDFIVERVRREFDLGPLAEEDNHTPHGRVRNLWLPCDPAVRGIPCPCRKTEAVHREGDYEWRDAPEHEVEAAADAEVEPLIALVVWGIGTVVLVSILAQGWASNGWTTTTSDGTRYSRALIVAIIISAASAWPVWVAVIVIGSAMEAAYMAYRRHRRQ